MFNYEKGHCVLLGTFKYVVKEVKDDLVFLMHISDPKGNRGKWVSKSLLPKPFAKIKIN